MPQSQIDQAANLVARRTTLRPIVGVVLGSGLGAFAERLNERIPYGDVPGMPECGVAGHAGALHLGRVGEVPVACLQGRVHLYEGHDPASVAFGVRLLGKLGCRAVLVTNAAGGIAAKLHPGDLMVITDQLNLTGRNLVSGTDGDGAVVTFTDMTEAYDSKLSALAHAAGREAGLTLHQGVYAGMLGPTYETPAEIRMLRTLGADAVGMSTVIEVAALRRMGVRVAAISCITNLGAGLSPTPPSHDDVREVAARMGSAFVDLLAKWVILVGKEVSQ